MDKVRRSAEASAKKISEDWGSLLYLLEGKLKHYVGDRIIILEKGDTLRIEAGVAHYAVSIGDSDADMIVVYPTPERKIVYED